MAGNNRIHPIKKGDGVSVNEAVAVRRKVGLSGGAVGQDEERAEERAAGRKVIGLEVVPSAAGLSDPVLCFLPYVFCFENPVIPALDLDLPVISVGGLGFDHFRC